VHDIADVAVNENLAGQQIHNFVSGNPAIGTADPQVLRILLTRQALEKFRVARLHSLRPLAVLFKQRL